MLALKDTCIDPITQKPYIRSLVGGKDSSIEGLQVRSETNPKCLYPQSQIEC